MVDPTVVVVENIYQRLGEAKDTGKSKFNVIVDATAEVGTPVIFGLIVTVLVFLPLMTLEGMEGKTLARWQLLSQFRCLLLCWCHYYCPLCCVII